MDEPQEPHNKFKEILIRFSQEELAQIDAAAKEALRPRRNFIRYAVLNVVTGVKND